MNEFKCLACGGQSFEPGVLGTPGIASCAFVPVSSPRWRRWLMRGASVHVRVCRSCGLAHPYADLEELDLITGEGETRCRRCRYILKGLTEPRCPECGERI